MNCYAVIDTNVLVSALIRKDSVPKLGVSHALEGKIIPLVNAEILEEYNDVLRRKKFKFNERAVEVLIAGIVSRAIHVDAIELNEYLPDPKDAIFYEIVMESRKEHDAYLVTGNLKHFPKALSLLSRTRHIEIKKASSSDGAFFVLRGHLWSLYRLAQ